jgi:protein arginine N-methyltransferase 3
LNASSLIKDREVLDVGCGTGILSMISARAGAKHVYAVDGSPEIAAIAQEIVEENKLTESIDVKSGRIEAKDTLPEGYKCDVIVSEWMGYCLLYESMLFSVLDARDKYLKEGGCVLPDIAQIFIAGCDESAITLSFWDDVEGFTMRSVGKKQSKAMQGKAHVMDVKGTSIVTSSALVKEFDLCTMKADDAKFFSQEFELNLVGVESSSQKKDVYALTIWFDTLFSKQHCPEEVVLTTSPVEDKTHWAQTLLVLPQPLTLSTDAETKDKATLRCRITLKQHSDDYRGLQLVLEYGHAKRGDNTYPHVAQYELV